MRSVRGATKKSQPQKEQEHKIKFFFMCLRCLFVAQQSGQEERRPPENWFQKDRLFEEPTYLVCSNANTWK